MSKASDFLQGWVATNIHAGSPDLDAEARRRAEECLTLAHAQAISRADIEAEVGPLEEHLKKALGFAEAFKAKQSAS